MKNLLIQFNDVEGEPPSNLTQVMYHYSLYCINWKPRAYSGCSSSFTLGYTHLHPPLCVGELKKGLLNLLTRNEMGFKAHKITTELHRENTNKQEESSPLRQLVDSSITSLMWNKYLKSQIYKRELIAAVRFQLAICLRTVISLSHILQKCSTDLA